MGAEGEAERGMGIERVMDTERSMGITRVLHMVYAKKLREKMHNKP